MAMSNKERQAAYRARQKAKREQGEGEGYRINTMINGDAYHSLNRLARHYGVTRREAMEQLIDNMETALLHGMTHGEETKYFDD